MLVNQGVKLDSTLVKFTCTLPKCVPICLALEAFALSELLFKQPAQGCMDRNCEDFPRPSEKITALPCGPVPILHWIFNTARVFYSASHLDTAYVAVSRKKTVFTTLPLLLVIWMSVPYTSILTFEFSVKRLVRVLVSTRKHFQKFLEFWHCITYWHSSDSEKCVAHSASSDGSFSRKLEGITSQRKLIRQSQ